MADEEPPVQLPPVLELLWGRRERGRRGPRPGLSPDAIAAAAIRIADAEGLDAVSMARVAHELGYTTMSLYRHVASKDELLQLMWNASAQGMENLVLEGEEWRPKLRMWAMTQRDSIDQHPWITQMPMATPPAGPNSMLFVEHGLAAMDGTGLTDSDKMSVIGLLSSYTLNEARMAADAMRAAQAAMAAAEPEAETNGTAAAPEPPPGFESLLRELVDEPTYPRLYRLAWSAPPASQRSEREEFLFGVDLILDGIQALIDRSGGG